MSAERTARQLNRVLIISNDDDLNLLLPFLLETDGFQVSVARTPDIAMQALLRHSPEVIFFDLSFEDGNNLSFVPRDFYFHSGQTGEPLPCGQMFADDGANARLSLDPS